MILQDFAGTMEVSHSHNYKQCLVTRLVSRNYWQQMKIKPCDLNQSAKVKGKRKKVEKR